MIESDICIKTGIPIIKMEHKTYAILKFLIIVFLEGH